MTLHTFSDCSIFETIHVHDGPTIYLRRYHMECTLSHGQKITSSTHQLFLQFPDHILDMGLKVRFIKMVKEHSYHNIHLKNPIQFPIFTGDKAAFQKVYVLIDLFVS